MQKGSAETPSLFVSLRGDPLAETYRSHPMLSIDLRASI